MLGKRTIISKLVVHFRNPCNIFKHLHFDRYVYYVINRT